MASKKIKRRTEKYSSSRHPKPPSKPREIGSGFTDQGLIDALGSLECGTAESTCAERPWHGMTFGSKEYADNIEYFRKNLPALPYVEKMFLHFLFSNGLTTGNEDQDNKVLEPFLYRNNILGITNYETLRSAVIQSREYGRCGIRWLSEEDGIILVPHNRYCALQVWDDKYRGFKKTVGYAVSLNNDPISLGTEPIELDNEEFEENGILINKDRSFIIVSPDEFVNLRDDVTTETGTSIFERDWQRFNLLASVYERLNYDIKYDGPGRIIFWLKDDIISSGDGVDLSTSEIVSQLANSKQERADRAQEELKRVATGIKESGSDNVILAPSMFKDNIEHLPRVTKATEFLEWINDEGVVIAQNFGISPSLIGLGGESGNVSMEKVIDNAMVNDIVPLRESIAIQISHMLSTQLHLRKIYFNKYELKQNIDYSTEIFKLAQSSSQLMNIKNANGETEESAKSTAEYIMSLIVKKLGGEVESMRVSNTTSTREEAVKGNKDNMEKQIEEGDV